MLQSSGDEQWIEKTSSKPSQVVEEVSAKESASVVKVQAISNIDIEAYKTPNSKNHILILMRSMLLELYVL